MDELLRVLGDEQVVAPGFAITWAPGKLRVAFETGRSQLVYYRLRGGHLLFRATIASARELEALAEATGQRYSALRTRLCRELLLQNEHTESVCFRLTEKDRLEAVLAQRAATLHRDELLYYASQLAREADRFEALLSDRDRW